MVETITESKADFFAGIIAAIDFTDKPRPARARPETVTQKEPTNLIERLNRIIDAGASFDVAAEDFQIVGAENLSFSEKDFLTANRTTVLCTLQQTLLMKHLFSAKPELLKNFIAKVNEQNARFEVLCEITAKWFARLIDTMPD